MTMAEQYLNEDLKEAREGCQYYREQTEMERSKVRDLEEAVQYWTELSQKFEAKLEALEVAVEELEKIQPEWLEAGQKRLERSKAHHRASKERARLERDAYFNGGMSEGIFFALHTLRQHGAIE